MKMTLKHTQNTNDKIRYNAFSCLIEIAKHYYDYISEYIPDILSLSLIHVILDSF